MDLETKQIRTDGGTQARATLDAGTVSDYREILRDSDATWPFPPVVVFHDGSEYWLADGFHRIAAAKQHGRFVVDADVRQGTQRDAVLFAAGANDAHGLRRTPDDKRRAVMRLLEDAEWGQWSDREIARRCNVSHPFVSSLRAATGNVTSERVYTNKHGETAVMQTAAIGNGAERSELSVDELRDKALAWMRAAGGQCYLSEFVSRLDKARDRYTLQNARIAYDSALALRSKEKGAELSPEDRRTAYIAGARILFKPIQDYIATADYLSADEDQVATERSLIRFLAGQTNEYDPAAMLKKLSEATDEEIAADLYSSPKRCIPDACANVRRWLKQRIYQAKTAASETEEPEEDTRTEGDLTIERASLVDAHAQKGNRSWDSVISRLADTEASGHDYAVDLARKDTGLADDEIVQAAQALLQERDRELQRSREEENKPPDETLVLLKKAEKSLGLAVATFNVAKHKEIFFKANDAYNKLLDVIFKYETEAK